LICIYPLCKWQRVWGKHANGRKYFACLFLGLAIGQLIYGPVSDRIGRKKPLYFGLTLYVIASLACVFASNEWALIIARIFQALGAVSVSLLRALRFVIGWMFKVQLKHFQV
jgi:MFS family permease